MLTRFTFSSIRLYSKALHRTMSYSMPDPISPSGSSPSRPPGRGRGRGGSKGRGGSGPSKPRGSRTDSPEVQLSKTLSYLLRHGAEKEGLPIRSDGYVKVEDLFKNSRLRSQGLELERLQAIVKADLKQRYSLISEADAASGLESWLIKANQGHSLKEVQLVLKPITALTDIPTGIAVHGTNKGAWKSISEKGLSKMKRNHIHLAQGMAGDSVISGMRNSSEIFIFIDITKALEAGIPFHMSDNGVILTEGDQNGVLLPEYFLRVEDAKGNLLLGAKE